MPYARVLVPDGPPVVGRDTGPPAMLVLLAMLGCQQPFGTDRHHLEGFRVAAVAADPAGGAPGSDVRPRAALIVDGHPWSDAPVSLRWTWVPRDRDAVVALSADDPADAEGPVPTLTMPDGDARLGLLAVSPAAEEYRAYLDLGAEPRTPPPLAGVDVTVGDVAADAVAAGETARLTARFASEPDDAPFCRWMATGGDFAEVDRTSADFTVPEDEGVVTVLLLCVDQLGGNAFVARDVVVGDATGAWTASDRFLPGDALTAGLYLGTLEADDTSPTGLALDAPQPTTDPDAGEDVCGETGPFDPSWLADQRCARQDVVGHAVVVEIR